MLHMDNKLLNDIQLTIDIDNQTGYITRRTTGQ